MNKCKVTKAQAILDQANIQPLTKSPSERCKELSITLAHVSRVSGTSVQTLINWHKNKPWLFDVVLAGVKALS